MARKIVKCDLSQNAIFHTFSTFFEVSVGTYFRIRLI